MAPERLFTCSEKISAGCGGCYLLELFVAAHEDENMSVTKFKHLETFVFKFSLQLLSSCDPKFI